MFRRLGLVLAALALFSIAGGHWAAFQTVAWAGMLRDYAQRTGSVAAAVGQTFDGEHPCELCRQIAAAKQSEKESRSPVSGTEKTSKAEKSQKATTPARLAFVCFPRTAASRGSFPSENVLPSRTDQPPTPPPRGSAVA